METLRILQPIRRFARCGLCLGKPYFYAFDLLYVDGVDLRDLPLVERKAKLRKLIPRKPSRCPAGFIVLLDRKRSSISPLR